MPKPRKLTDERAMELVHMLETEKDSVQCQLDDELCDNAESTDPIHLEEVATLRNDLSLWQDLLDLAHGKLVP